MSEPILLELRDVVKSYEATEDALATPVLQGLCLQVFSGDSVAIVGPSGSGKSTLLHIMGALDVPNSGLVFLNGKDLAGMNETERARIRNQEIGFIFQLHHLLPQCTTLENTLIPTLAGAKPNRTENPQDRALRLLDRVGLSHRLNHRPGQLSGGERQRAAVVRALINEPKLLLADEPTGALDRAAADNLADLLVELNREEGVTLITITHAQSLAERMERILELKDGRLVGGSRRA